MTLEELQLILKDIKCSVGGTEWHPTGGVMGDGFYVQLRYLEPDIETGDMEDQHSRKWYVSSHSVKSEVVQTVLKATLTSAEHMVREHFTFKGERIYGPHFDVDTLHEMVQSSRLKKDVRPPK